MNTKPNTVCIIDDDPIFVFATKKIMQHSHFHFSFLEFVNGQEAIDYFRPRLEKKEEVPELILLDLNMPVMDGWQFLEEISTIPSEQRLTIYIISSSILPVDINKAKEYELVTNYIIKPVTHETLKKIVENSFADIR